MNDKIHVATEILKSCDLSSFQHLPDNFATICEHNCENIIGGLTVPLGVAGPMKIDGNFAHGDYLVPLATTEACLVASVNRGAKLCAQAGLISTQLQHIGISRAPVLKVKKLQSDSFYEDFLEQNKDKLQDIINTTSSHLTLKSWQLKTDTAQNCLYINFFFDSGDAMGMNMATIGSKAICRQLLEPELHAQLITISSNWCSDKKPSLSTKKNGRGYSVAASIELPHELLQNKLHCTPETLMEVYQTKIITGSQLAESIGQNAHHANMIAALYLATGQDLAHVGEGSLGNTTIEQKNSSIIFSVTLPALICGTIGGGTKLPHQHAALHKILQLKQSAGQGNQAKELAEIIAATVLCGELSLMGALASRELADVHNAFRK